MIVSLGKCLDEKTTHLCLIPLTSYNCLKSREHITSTLKECWMLSLGIDEGECLDGVKSRYSQVASFMVSIEECVGIVYIGLSEIGCC